jgi:hypothetical protein
LEYSRWEHWILSSDGHTLLTAFAISVRGDDLGVVVVSEGVVDVSSAVVESYVESERGGAEVATVDLSSIQRPTDDRRVSKVTGVVNCTVVACGAERVA